VKSDALRLAESAPDPVAAGNLIREYVQASILRSLHESRAFESLSFVGGTALRFLYNLPRFSEDLDFSLETPERYAPENWLKKLKRDLGFQGFDATISLNEYSGPNLPLIPMETCHLSGTKNSLVGWQV
jgi:predicted nucleotidyltransferase component of viral defense system